jgi:hypothetical protein
LLADDGSPGRFDLLEVGTAVSSASSIVFCFHRPVLKYREETTALAMLLTAVPIQTPTSPRSRPRPNAGNARRQAKPSRMINILDNDNPMAAFVCPVPRDVESNIRNHPKNGIETTKIEINLDASATTAPNLSMSLDRKTDTTGSLTMKIPIESVTIIAPESSSVRRTIRSALDCCSAPTFCPTIVVAPPANPQIPRFVIWITRCPTPYAAGGTTVPKA